MPAKNFAKYSELAAELKKLLSQAPDRNDADAYPRWCSEKNRLAVELFELGERLEAEADYNLAAQAYWSAMEAGHQPVKRRLFELHPIKSMVKEKLGDAADTTDIFYKGLRHFAGIGTAIDFKKATTYFKAAAKQNYPAAFTMLGIIYDNSNSDSSYHNQAITYFQQAAQLNDATALTNLGYIHENGIGVIQDYQQAIAYYKQAVDQNHSKAMNNLGCMYDYGRGVDLDYQQALTYLQQAAKQNDPHAFVNLGDKYKEGSGIPQDYEKAANYYALAAEQKEPFTQTPARKKLKALCSSKLTGTSSEHARQYRRFYQLGIPEALPLLEKCVETGDVLSRYHLAQLGCLPSVTLVGFMQEEPDAFYQALLADTLLNEHIRFDTLFKLADGYAASLSDEYRGDLMLKLAHWFISNQTEEQTIEHKLIHYLKQVPENSTAYPAALALLMKAYLATGAASEYYQSRNAYIATPEGQAMQQRFRWKIMTAEEIKAHHLPETINPFNAVPDKADIELSSAIKSMKITIDLANCEQAELLTLLNLSKFSITTKLRVLDHLFESIINPDNDTSQPKSQCLTSLHRKQIKVLKNVYCALIQNAILSDANLKAELSTLTAAPNRLIDFQLARFSLFKTTQTITRKAINESLNLAVSKPLENTCHGKDEIDETIPLMRLS